MHSHILNCSVRDRAQLSLFPIILVDYFHLKKKTKTQWETSYEMKCMLGLYII